MAPPVAAVATAITMLLAGGTLWGTSGSWSAASQADELPDPEDTISPPASFRGGGSYHGSDADRRLGRNQDIMIFGFYNTGTNRLQSLLHALWPGASVCPDTKGHWGPKTCKSRGPSKHGNPQRIRRFLRSPRYRHRNVLLTVRDPFSNLLADLREPYQLGSCISESKPDWLTRRCSCSKIGKPDPLCKPRQRSYSSVVAIWNTYTKGAYYAARRKWPGRSGKIHIVRYEDFFVNPGKTMKKVRKALKLPPPKSDVDIIAVLSKPAKANDVPYPKRVQTIQSKSYLSYYSSAQVRSLCKRLDRKLARKLGYGKEC